MALIDDPRYKRCHVLLHHLWTRAGTTHYVKREWQALEQAIEFLARPDYHAEQELDEEICRLLGKTT